MNIRMNNAVAANLRLAADISMRRIDEGHALFEHQASNSASTNKVFELGQLRASVDSRYFPHIGVLRETDAFVGSSQDRRYIGQVVFVLAVRWLYFFQSAEEFFAVETINARIYFPN